MSLPTGSRWMIHRVLDTGAPVSDQRIEILSSTGGQFMAKYVSIADPSAFTGEIGQREGEVINIKQHNQARGYLAFHSGLRVGTKNQYEGRWYSDAGEAGVFRLSQE
jgi:hypothetical protein